MQSDLAAIAAKDEIEGVCAQYLKACEPHGSWCQTYHITPRFARQNSPHIRLVSRGVPDNFKRLYRDANFRSMDPIPDHVVEVGRTMTWQEAIDDIRSSGIVTSDHERYFLSLAERGFSHGIGIPLYGPNHRNGFAAFGFSEPVDLASPTVRSLEALSRVAHNRIAELVDSADKCAINLSDREHQVLEQIARGCSNVEIGRRLGISAETVQTYIKRLFDKLDTRDRVGATVKGLKLGLIYA